MPARVPPADAAGDDFCYLTTTGRRTGRPHEIEIWFALDGDRVVMLAGGRHGSDWVQNLEVHPEVTIRLRDLTYRCRASLVDEDHPLDRRARDLLFDKYEPRHPGLAEWRESALPVCFEVLEDL